MRIPVPSRCRLIRRVCPGCAIAHAEAHAR
jgi:hypothetical protein